MLRGVNSVTSAHKFRSITLITIFLVIFLFISLAPVQASDLPENDFATEVLLTKSEFGYDLARFEPHIEAGTVNLTGFYYIYRSHFDRDLGVVLNEVNEPYAGVVGLSVSLVIPTEWQEAPPDNASYPGMILVPTVELDPETLDWELAMYTELKWLLNESIIKGLTEATLRDLGMKVGAGYAGWNARIVYENGLWMPYNETEDPILVFGGSGFQLNAQNLPDTVPYPMLSDGPKPAVKKDQDYGLLMIAGALIAIVLLGAFSYSRIKRRSVLDNLNRKNIFEHVKANPGIHFNKLIRELEMQPGALSYHLNVLEKKEYVKSIQDGNYRRFFLYGTSTDFKIALTSIQLRILSIVNERPGISQSKISKTIGKNRMLINYHVKILRDAGILSVEKSGRESLCFTTSSAMVYLPG